MDEGAEGGAVTGAEAGAGAGAGAEVGARVGAGANSGAGPGAVAPADGADVADGAARPLREPDLWSSGSGPCLART